MRRAFWLLTMLIAIFLPSVGLGQTFGLLQDWNPSGQTASAGSAGTAVGASTNAPIDVAGSVWSLTSGTLRFTTSSPASTSYQRDFLYFSKWGQNNAVGCIIGVVTVQSGSAVVAESALLYNQATGYSYQPKLVLNGTSGTIAIYKCAPTATQIGSTGSFTIAVGKKYRVVEQILNGGVITCSVYDVTGGGSQSSATTSGYVATTTATDTTITSGGFALTDSASGGGTQSFDEVLIYGLGLSGVPSTAYTSWTTSVTLTNNAANWTAGTTTQFSISGVSGVSLGNPQTVTSSSSATVSVIAGSNTGTATLTDSITGLTVQIAISNPPALTPGALTQVYDTTTGFSYTIGNTTGGRGSYTYQWYLLPTASTTYASQYALSNGSGVSGATGTTLVETASTLTAGTTYFIQCVVTDSSSTPVSAGSNVALGSPLNSPNLIVAAIGDSLTYYQGLVQTTASIRYTTDAFAVALASLYKPRSVTMINEGRSGYTSGQYSSTDTSTILTSGSTGTVGPSATTTAIPITLTNGINGDQLSGATINFTSGTLSGTSRTITFYDAIAQTAYVSTALSSAPASGVTITITNTTNCLACTIAAMNYWGANYASICLGNNDCKSGVAYSASTHQSNMTALCNALFAGVSTLQKVVIQTPSYMINGVTTNVNNASLDLQIAYQAADTAMCNGSTIVRGDTTLYSLTYTNQTLQNPIDGAHPYTTYSFQIFGNAWGYGFLKAVGTIPAGGGGNFNNGRIGNLQGFLRLL